MSAAKERSVGKLASPAGEVAPGAIPLAKWFAMQMVTSWFVVLFCCPRLAMITKILRLAKPFHLMR